MFIDPVCLQHVQGLFLLLHKRCSISIYLQLRFPAHSTSIESGGCDGVSLSTTHRGVLQRWEKLEKDRGRWREWQMGKKKQKTNNGIIKKTVVLSYFSITAFCSSFYVCGTIVIRHRLWPLHSCLHWNAGEVQHCKRGSFLMLLSLFSLFR